MINFAGRNLKLYFRRKSAVFASLLGVMIIVVLYALFLGDMFTIEGVENAKELMDTWMISGLVAITPFTTAFGALGAMVDDKSGGQLRDFYASPVRRVNIVGGYVLSGLTVGLLLSLAALVLGEIYIFARGGSLLSLSDLGSMLGAILLSVTLSGTMGFFIICFIKTVNTYMVISILIGSMTGFLTGMYVPVGSLSEGVQWLVKLFPVSHSAVIFRQIMCRQAMEASFAGMPEYAGEYSKAMGIHFEFGGWTMPVWVHCAVIILLSAVFFALATIKVSREKTR